MKWTETVNIVAIVTLAYFFLVFYRYRINSFYNDAERRAVSLRQLT